MTKPGGPVPIMRSKDREMMLQLFTARFDTPEYREAFAYSLMLANRKAPASYQAPSPQIRPEPKPAPK